MVQFRHCYRTGEDLGLRHWTHLDSTRARIANSSLGAVGPLVTLGPRWSLFSWMTLIKRERQREGESERDRDRERERWREREREKRKEIDTRSIQAVHWQCKE